MTRGHRVGETEMWDRGGWWGGRHWEKARPSLGGQSRWKSPRPASTGWLQGSRTPASTHRELACFLLPLSSSDISSVKRTFLCIPLAFRNGIVVQELFHKKGTLPFVTTWMNVEDSEISQTHKDKYCVIPLIRGI